MGSTAKNEPARENVPVTATVSTTANSACATVPADSLASGQKKNVPNSQILPMARYLIYKSCNSSSILASTWQVHLTGRHFNDRAVYTCDDGYQIVGLEQVICNSNGKWSGTQPSCKQGTSSSQSRYYCGTPTVIPHAKHNGSSEQVSQRLLKLHKIVTFKLCIFRCFTTWILNCPTNVTRATNVKVFKWPNVSSIMVRPDGLDPTSLVILLIVDHLKKYSMEKEPVTVPLTDVR